MEALPSFNFLTQVPMDDLISDAKRLQTAEAKRAKSVIADRVKTELER